MTRLTGNERAIVVTALRHAVPYIRMYKHKVFVLKAGGSAFASARCVGSCWPRIRRPFAISAWRASTIRR
jgi:hypothetical protein